MLLTQVIILIVSLLVVIKSADYFTDSAERIGVFFGLSPFIIGTVILSVGTSLPELATSVSAVLQKHSEIVVADVVGSNITNILLVLGVSLTVNKSSFLQHDASIVDLPILIASVFFIYLSFINGKFTFVEGLFFIAALVVYIIYALSSKKTTIEEGIPKPTIKDPIILILSIVLLDLGSKYTIKSIVEISKTIGISTSIIAATIIALGTSLPELMVSATAAKKGKLDIAIGNVVGSNIFNVFGVVGISSIFGTLKISESTVKIGFPYLIASSFLLAFIAQNKKQSKWVGLILMNFYLFYIFQLFFKT